MKTNNLWMLIINPFTRIAGWQALAVGIVFIVLTAIIGTFSSTVFDGVIDMHFVKSVSLKTSLLMQAFNLVSITVVMYVAALLVSKNFRFIDILGTMAFARIPYFFLSFFGFFTTIPNFSALQSNPADFYHSISASFIIAGMLTIPVIVWYITLLRNALKVSCNIKGSRLVVVLIVGIILTEIISKLLIGYFL